MRLRLRPNARVARFELGEEELAVVSLPARVTLPKTLTPAERAIAKAIGKGLSNAQIARARKTSERTVANQVASLLRKMNVASRAELALKLAR